MRFLLLFGFLSLTTFNLKAELLCSHPQICNLMSIGFEKSLLQSVVVTIGDHHHYEPPANVVKTFLKTPFLLAGPNALHPWLKPILLKRSKEQTTVSAVIHNQFFSDYQTKNAEALSHFWLYSDISCSFYEQYEKTLIQKNILPQQKNGKELCQKRYQNLNDELKLTLQNIKYPIILTHDALAPLLIKMGARVHSLKGSGHHEEIRPQVIKKLQDEIKAQPAVWIKESGFDIPIAVKKLIKKNDLIVNVDPNGKLGDNVEDALKELITKLKEIK